MELSIKKNPYDGKWFDFGNGRLKVRPYPASKGSFIVRNGAVVFLGEQTLDKFRYCLTAWDGFVTPGDHVPIELTDEVKKKVFDFRVGSATIDGQEVSMSDFVSQKADELFAEAREAEKNLSPGPSGVSQTTAQDSTAISAA